MSLRTTDEILRSHYGLPIPAHWDKYHRAWTEFGYATYFRNSAIVTVASVVLVTVLGAMAAFAFARRRYAFPGREPLFLLIFLSIMFPPQIMLLALFQILVQYRLFNTLTGLVLVYVGDRAAADDLPPAGLLRPDPDRAGGGGADRRLRRLARCSGGSCSRSRSPPSPPP